MVYSSAVVGMKTSLRNRLSALIHGDNAKTAEEAIAELTDWKPGVVGTRKSKDPTQAFLELYTKANDEQKAEMLKALQAG